TDRNLTNEVSVVLAAGKVQARAQDSSAFIQLETPGKIYADGHWHHVAFTRQTSTSSYYLYLDGLQVATTTKTPDLGDVDTTGQPAYIGRTAGDSKALFHGSIDEVAPTPPRCPSLRFRRGRRTAVSTAPTSRPTAAARPT